MPQRDNNIEAPEESAIAIAKVAFSELTLGRVVGEGGFCRVAEVSSVDLDEIYDTSDEETRHRKQFRNQVRKNSQLQDQGGTRYVLKMLRGDLPEEEHTKGIVDLAIEAEFLSFLSHPNIITMRAMAHSDPHADRFFVVLDRLTQTLDRKFNYWRKLVGDNSGYWVPLVGYCCSKTPTLHAIWKERISAALNIAKAIQYLHSLGIVYRDLKPDNIGFDYSGALKVFDFGLAKRLDTVEKSTEGRYLLTGNTGSLRYMAPEVARSEPYNLTVDSFSFGIIFWQICSLTTPFAGYTEKMHAEKVVRQGQRPVPDATWPLSWVDLMKQCWDANAKLRPQFDAIVESMEDRYYELEQEEVVPTRANEIKAKKRKPKVQGDDRLDVDTRIATVDTMNGTNGGGGGSDAAIGKRHEADIV